MKQIIALIFICILRSNSAQGEELYQRTAQTFGTCLGKEMKFVYNPPDRIRDVIKEKCGQLEALEQEQFLDFIREQVDKPLSARTAFQISARIIASPQRLREDVIEAYLSVMKKTPNSKSLQK